VAPPPPPPPPPPKDPPLLQADPPATLTTQSYLMLRPSDDSPVSIFTSLHWWHRSWEPETVTLRLYCAHRDKRRFINCLVIRLVFSKCDSSAEPTSLAPGCTLPPWRVARYISIITADGALLFLIQPIHLLFIFCSVPKHRAATTNYL